MTTTCDQGRFLRESTLVFWLLPELDLNQQLQLLIRGWRC